MDLRLCQHCKSAPVGRPRGLCWKCYYEHGIRELYPPTHPCAIPGLGGGPGRSTPATIPTLALPGTPEKEAVMAIRCRLRQDLHHPHDARHLR